MDDVVRQVLAAIHREDWLELKGLLHPYLHWTDDHGTRRGRVKVLAHLAEHPVTEEPSSWELRDGQIYRWTSA